MSIDSAVEVLGRIALDPLLNMAAKGITHINVFACNLQVHMQTASGPGVRLDYPQLRSLKPVSPAIRPEGVNVFLSAFSQGAPAGFRAGCLISRRQAIKRSGT
ncbi:MAG: hypothetical protein AAF441_14685 [Pseudomonadota bacterium]